MLPYEVDALKFCQQRVVLTGQLPISAMPRLLASLVAEEGVADVDVHFSVDEQARKRIGGTVQAQVQMQCQRCLNAVAVDVSSEVQVALVWSDEQAANLPRGIEPVEVDDAHSLSLLELVEDELLLALPLVAHHSQCEMPTFDPGATLVDEGKKDNPFQVLAALKSAVKNDKP